jgi:glycosyltransferase involved in cell wall biosynthesis
MVAIVLTIRTIKPLGKIGALAILFFVQLEKRPFRVKLMTMKISVIVPAFNEEKLIAATLRGIGAALAGFSHHGWMTEIIVCDNNSTDATAALSRAAGAQVVFEPVNQIARARNTGAAAATGEWLVFVDADSRPTPELFAEAARHMKGGRCLAGGCTVRLDERHFLADWGTSGWNLISRMRRWVAGSFIFCERETFGAVGGFSLELYASEEIDFSKKLNKLAREQGREVVILHRHPLLTSARKIRLYSRRELLDFLRRAIFSPRRTVTNRDACSPWYDGRR